MKKLLVIAIVGAALVLPSALHAQNYSINWYTVAGGGGSSSGTNGGSIYSVSGTIGQPATATMSGGNYSLTAGFWSIIAALQTPGAPLLSITRSGSQATVSWSSSATGFVLQQSSTLLSNSWTASTYTMTTNVSTISVMVPSASGYQYFRLVNP
jgi:opacity protein-like surface antigen